MKFDACRAAGIFLSILTLILPISVQAETFKYVDRDGVIHFTNIIIAKPEAKVLQLNQQKTSFGAPRSKGASVQASNHNAYDAQIKSICGRYDLNCQLVKAVIRAESAFNPEARSPKGAVGLMQLMPGTSRDMGVTNPYDPTQNIEGGARYLKYLLTRFNNDWTHALAAYNAGPETVEKYGGIPPYDETRTYIQRVKDFYQQY